jgi:O-antigen/teichoic acid export membrane protein
MDVTQYSWPRILRQVLLVTMRALTAGAKFALAIYTARYLGLSDLGIYGLLIAGTTFVPAVTGLGLTDWIVRKIVDLPRSEALPLIACRSLLTLSVHCIVQPVAFATNLWLGEPIPMQLALLSGAVLLLENVGSETSDLLVARRHVILAHTLTFLRTGLWPMLVIALWHGRPETRTLTVLLLNWLAALVVNMTIILSLSLQHHRWRMMRPRPSLLFAQLRYSWPLYIKDVCATFGIFVDRFLISMFLGLELAGVYTLFWSIGNVVHSLVIVGMLQAQLPPLLAAGRMPDKQQFRALFCRLQIETGIWALLLTAAAAVSMPLLLPLLGRPLLQDNLAIFWIVLVATLLRVAADGYGLSLLALSRDRAIAVTAVIGAAGSAALNTVLTAVAGLWGAAITYVVISGALFVIRYTLVRDGARDGSRSVTPTVLIDAAPRLQ